MGKLDYMMELRCSEVFIRIKMHTKQFLHHFRTNPNLKREKLWPEEKMEQKFFLLTHKVMMIAHDGSNNTHTKNIKKEKASK